MLLEKGNHLFFGALSPHDTQSQLLQLLILRQEFMIVNQEKHFGCGDGDSLIPIQKGMIRTEMEKISSRFLLETFMQKISSVDRLGHGHCGFQQSPVPQTWVAAKLQDQLRMNLGDLVNPKEDFCFHYSAKWFSTRDRFFMT